MYNYNPILDKIVFDTQALRKNFDIVPKSCDNIITEHTGTINEIRSIEKKPPIFIGEYGFSVWNILLAKMFDININKIIESYRIETTYNEIMTLIEDKIFDIYSYNKIVFVHGLIVHPDYRKIGITEEFAELLYRDYYADDIAIIALAKPIQNNRIDFNSHYKNKMIRIRSKLGDYDKFELIPAIEYYSLNQLMEKKDSEANKYRLFAVANKCGFQRINNSSLFLFKPDVIIDRIKEKNKYFFQNNISM
jgi:hypothetical protein